MRNAYPGWINTVNGNTVAWPAMLLPYLERNDLYQVVSSGGTPGVFLKVLSCPSDPPLPSTGPGAASYIINGLVARVGTTGSTIPPLSFDYVSNNDGTAYTLILGENTQSMPAGIDIDPGLGATPRAHNWYDTNSQINQGFGIDLLGGHYSADLGNFSAVYGAGAGPYGGNAMAANMNSWHGPGANVGFCDGHGQFLSETVGVTTANGSIWMPVYRILVTPDGSTHGEPPADESQWAPQ